MIVPADPENPPTLESIREHAAQTLSKFKLPRKVLYRDIPRNSSGNLLKHRLRDAARAESVGVNLVFESLSNLLVGEGRG